MKVSRRRLAQGLVIQLQRHPAKTKQIIRQAAAYLIATRRAHEVDLLVRDVAQQLITVDGRLSADVESAFKLNASTRHALDQLLRKATGATKVELSERINPELLGGMVVRTPQAELDTSIKTQLARLGGGNV